MFHVKHAPLNGPGDLKQLALLALDLARQAEAARPTVIPSSSAHRELTIRQELRAVLYSSLAY